MEIDGLLLRSLVMHTLTVDDNPSVTEYEASSKEYSWSDEINGETIQVGDFHFVKKWHTFTFQLNMLKLHAMFEDFNAIEDTVQE